MDKEPDIDFFLDLLLDEPIRTVDIIVGIYYLGFTEKELADKHKISKIMVHKLKHDFLQRCREEYEAA